MKSLTCDNCRFTARFEEECGAYHERWTGNPRKCKVLLATVGQNGSHIDGNGYVDNRNELGVLNNCPRNDFSEKECLDIVKVEEIKYLRRRIDTNNNKIQRLVAENDDFIDQLIVILEEE